jgi:hypothetical protein
MKRGNSGAGRIVAGSLNNMFCMKKLFFLIVAAFVLSCNQSGPPGSAPGDTDHTDNNDTLPLKKTDSSRTVIPDKRVDSTDSLRGR